MPLLTLTGEEVVRTYLPVAYENLSIRPCAIQASGLLAIGDGPRLITLPAYAGSTSEAVLTIVSPMEEGPETRRFRLSHRSTGKHREYVLCINPRRNL